MTHATNHADVLTAPSWTRTVLRAAGGYNLFWGLFAILTPMTFFRWAGFDPLPHYPQLWQCVGMIVGVYGVGYWIAASDPYRHWPIVLVGLLGKVFGPIGFVFSVFTGNFPAQVGWTILTNDLVWWVPFAGILFGAARASQTRTALDLADAEPTTDEGRTFDDLTADGRTLAVFVRHAGCTFCRQMVTDLHNALPSFESDGVRPLIVHQSQHTPKGQSDGGSRGSEGQNGQEQSGQEDWITSAGLRSVTRLSDPAGTLYRRFGFPVGRFGELFGPRVWQSGFQACVVDRHGVGMLDGNGFQMPGLVAVENGRVVEVLRANDASWRPDFVNVYRRAFQPADSAGRETAPLESVEA